MRDCSGFNNMNTGSYGPLHPAESRAIVVDRASDGADDVPELYRVDHVMTENDVSRFYQRVASQDLTDETKDLFPNNPAVMAEYRRALFTSFRERHAAYRPYAEYGYPSELDLPIMQDDPAVHDNGDLEQNMPPEQENEAGWARHTAMRQFSNNDHEANVRDYQLQSHSPGSSSLVEQLQDVNFRTYDARANGRLVQTHNDSQAHRTISSEPRRFASDTDSSGANVQISTSVDRQARARRRQRGYITTDSPLPAPPRSRMN